MRRRGSAWITYITQTSGFLAVDSYTYDLFVGTLIPKVLDAKAFCQDRVARTLRLEMLASEMYLTLAGLLAR